QAGRIQYARAQTCTQSYEQLTNFRAADEVSSRHWLHVGEVPAGWGPAQRFCPVDPKYRVDRRGDILRVNRPVLVPIEPCDLGRLLIGGADDAPGMLDSASRERSASHRRPVVATLDRIKRPRCPSELAKCQHERLFEEGRVAVPAHRLLQVPDQVRKPPVELLGQTVHTPRSLLRCFFTPTRAVYEPMVVPAALVQQNVPGARLGPHHVARD